MAASYSGLVRKLVIELKFHGQIRHAGTLASLFVEQLHAEKTPDVLIPVPLHKYRLRERGFNQSYEIARHIGRSTGVPVDYNGVYRRVQGERQADLPLKKRRANVKGVFHLQAPFCATHVAIVDDVMTSGHTVNELAKTLKQSGIEQVSIWVMARASHS